MAPMMTSGQDVTADLFNFSQVGTGGTMADDYWSDATTELTDATDGNFTNWWTGWI